MTHPRLIGEAVKAQEARAEVRKSPEDLFFIYYWEVLNVVACFQMRLDALRQFLILLSTEEKSKAANPAPLIHKV